MEKKTELEPKLDQLDLPVSRTPTSLSITGKITLGDFDHLLTALASAHGSINWWIGDAINAAVAKWGEKYARWEELTGMSRSRLDNFAWVAGSVDPSTRVEELTWSHHRAVARLGPDAQRAELEAALLDGLSSGKLQQRVARRPDLVEQPNSAPSTKVMLASLDKNGELVEREGVKCGGCGCVYDPEVETARLKREARARQRARQERERARQERERALREPAPWLTSGKPTREYAPMPTREYAPMPSFDQFVAHVAETFSTPRKGGTA